MFQIVHVLHARASLNSFGDKSNGSFQVELMSAKTMYHMLLSLILDVVLVKTWR